MQFCIITREDTQVLHDQSEHCQFVGCPFTIAFTIRQHGQHGKTPKFCTISQSIANLLGVPLLLFYCFFTAFQYDLEGNITRRTEIATGNYRIMTWDYRNRLAMVADHLANNTLLQRVHYRYDAFNRLIGQLIDTDGNGEGKRDTQILDLALCFGTLKPVRK